MNDDNNDEKYNKKLANTLSSILSILTKENNKIFFNNLTINTNTNNTINNTNNGNINNGTVNNITTNMNFIYPFGNENIAFLSNNDMLEILKSPNSLLLALKKIYSRLENKNFHKRNSNKDGITLINSELKLEVFREKEFRQKLISQTIFLLRRIFFSCKDELSIAHQMTIWKNIKLIEDKSKKNEEHINDAITNLIEINSEDLEVKELFKDFIKNIKEDENLKKKCLELINNVINEINKYNNDLNKVSITDDIIKNKIWKQNNDNSNIINLDNEENNINNNRIEDTPRYRFYNEMEQCEINYFSTNSSLSLGDINFLCNRYNKHKQTEYNLLCNKFNPLETYKEELKIKLFKEPLIRAKDDLYNIKFITKNNNKII